MKTFTLKLSIDEVELLGEALDSHLYWQISEEHERNDGFVYYPEKDSREYRAGSEDDQARWQEMSKIEALETRLRALLAEKEK